MLIIVSIVVCASVITTILFYINYRMHEIGIWIVRPHDSNTKEVQIDDSQEKFSRKVKSIFFVFPLCVILYSVLIWICSLLLNLFNIV